MTTDEATRQIKEALAAETSAIALSNRLFTPEGLFHWLASTDEQRKHLVTTPLFVEAQRRVRELQYAEAAAMGRSIARATTASRHQGTGPSGEPAKSL